jgi:methionyl aminopeptidase
LTINSTSDLDGLRRVGRLVAETLRAMREAVRPGVTTGAIDDIGAAYARKHGARSAPQLTYRFPGFNCISVNDEIVHGIPGLRVIQPGDLVKLDVTLELDGFIADSAATVLVPPVAPEGRALVRCARMALGRALETARVGTRLAEVGRVIEAEAHRHGFHVVRELAGHGVGRTIHENPSVPNYPDPRARQELWDGLVIAVEPMLSALPAHVVEATDGWTLRTHNKSLAVHQEHTIVVRNGAPIILTAAA